MLINDIDLKQLIVKTGLAESQKVDELIQYAQNINVPLTEALIERDVISDENLGILIADFLKIPFIVLSKISIPENVYRLLPERMARKYKVIPFAEDETTVKLAMTDPNNPEVILALARKTGREVSAYLTTERDLENAQRIYKKNLQKSFEELLKRELGEIDPTQLAERAPVEKIVSLLIEFAYYDKTSDIHIEPQEEQSLVRFRIDGILHDVLFYPKNLHERIISRIKILSRLRTDEHLAPQDGKMRVELEEETMDIRVSILPVTDGEKAVLRLLASRYRQFSLINLGMSEADLAKMTAAYNKSFGMILSTGPTGSGKTTSIYSILKILNTRDKNITTIEDPVEYRIRGVNQIQVNTKTELTFANGLRSILRQDPNIVFVGEIRDAETAAIAVNASLTGHLVLSTLHTNDAATTLPRLMDMQVEPFLVASTVNVIVGQRLVRKICEMCKISYSLSEATLTQNIPAGMVKKHLNGRAEMLAYRGQGCKVCRSGYSGRIGLFEILEVTKEIKDLITKKVDASAILDKAIEEGMITMLDDGLNKIARGITTLEEVLRVTKVEKA